MGFGILFIGYMLTFGSLFFTTYLYADIIGCGVMIVASLMLARYQKSFKFVAMTSGVLAFVYAAAAAMRLMGYGTPPEAEAVLLGEQIYMAIQMYAVSIASLLFYASLFFAVAKLAKEVDLPHIVKRCNIYIVVFGIYFTVWALFSAFAEKVAAASVRVYNVTASGLVLFNGIWLIMVVLLLMSCMKWIAPAEEVEAEERGEEVKGNLLTRIGIKLDKIQETANTPREEKEARKMRAELEAAEKSAADSKNSEE